MFARVVGDRAEIHIVSADQQTLDGLREALSKQTVDVQEHVVERPDGEQSKRVMSAWNTGKMLPPSKVEEGYLDEDEGGTICTTCSAWLTPRGGPYATDAQLDEHEKRFPKCKR